MSLASHLGSLPVGLVGLVALALPASGQDVDTPLPASGAAEAGLEAQEMSELVERDRTLSFTVRAADRARADLDTGPRVPGLRAAALMALGCAGEEEDVARLVGALDARGDLERVSALLALGELGPIGARALLALPPEKLEGVEDAFALALARSADPEARGELQRLASGADEAAEEASALGRGAAELLAAEGLAAPGLASGGLASGGLAAGADAPPDTRVGRSLLELRYRAARRYGLVDGRRRRAVLLFELLADRDFLDALVLGAAAEDRSPIVLEHLGELLRGPDALGAGALRVAATVLPDELARRIRAEQIRPSARAWSAMVEEIEFRGAQSGARSLLEIAFEREELEGWAGRLLVAGGAELPEDWLEKRLVAVESPERAALVAAVGERGERELAELLRPYRSDDPDPFVRGSALVALRRLADEEALRELRELLAAPRSDLRDAAIVAMARVPHDREILSLLRDVAREEDLGETVRYEVDLALASQGLLEDTRRLREGAFLDRSPLRLRALVRALTDRPSEADIALLTELFPLERSPAANVDVAILLVRMREPLLFDFLRRALWTADWHQSVLAGGLFLRARGVHGLIDELLAPPPGATDRDHRRVGFALGQWAGLRAVEALARRRAGGDAALQGAYLGALSALPR